MGEDGANPTRNDGGAPKREISLLLEFDPVELKVNVTAKNVTPFFALGMVRMAEEALLSWKAMAVAESGSRILPGSGLEGMIRRASFK